MNSESPCILFIFIYLFILYLSLRLNKINNYKIYYFVKDHERLTKIDCSETLFFGTPVCIIAPGLDGLGRAVIGIVGDLKNITMLSKGKLKLQGLQESQYEPYWIGGQWVFYR
ncbi:hypothetical protein ABMA28_011405 [Loxostege sticticalis]|uniref:Uncharacterized protein n=1 Tax=Loxostege sticticalis TaxID=481309 RepID=A0ABD0S532_LOXSC